MPLSESLIFAVFFAIAAVVVPWLSFALASLFAGFPRLRIRQVLGLVAVSGWVFGFFNTLGPGAETDLLVFSTAVLALVAFAGMWAREFRLLMSRRADEFPDRSDKLIWAFALTAVSPRPAVLGLFGPYRRARWA